MPDLPARIRQDLASAMKGRDLDAARVLRTVLSDIANAEAQPSRAAAPVDGAAAGPIAGAARGLGSTEVARRELGDDEVREIVAAERAERLSAAAELSANGAHQAAGTLRAEADLLAQYLD